MNIDPDDPRLTAYALGELDQSESAQIELALASNGVLAASATAIRSVGMALKNELAKEKAPGLSSAQRLRIETVIKSIPPKEISWWSWFNVAAILFVIVVFVGVMAPVLFTMKVHSRVEAEIHAIKEIAVALEAYRSDFMRYPPDDVPTRNGSQVLAYYLCKEFKYGESHYGPYLAVSALRLRGGTGGLPELLSPLNNTYEYRLVVDKDGKPAYLLIDPGLDHKLGGTIDPQKGFVPDGSGADQDNLVEGGSRDNVKVAQSHVESDSKIKLARQQIKEILYAAEVYHERFLSYPPDRQQYHTGRPGDQETVTDPATIYKYLCSRITTKEGSVEPFLLVPAESLKNNVFVDPWGNPYEFDAVHLKVLPDGAVQPFGEPYSAKYLQEHGTSPGSNNDLRWDIKVWSAGPDGKWINGSNTGTDLGDDPSDLDNITSWSDKG